MEQWNGNLGPGILNAVTATRRAMDSAKQNTIGCVALANTNHWMRGGYYGWQAAREGFVFIGFTNTIANMPAWNAVDTRLGNNPLVIALPFNDDAIVLDMAMSQFSFGAMEMAAIKNEKLKVNGGYDIEGRLTDDPSAILQSQRPLPAGYWKGAGLSLLLDLLASTLSGGLSTHEVSRKNAEYAVSQVFIAIDPGKLHNHSVMAETINNIIADYHLSIAAGKGGKILYPGERVLQTRENNLKNGIPVLKEIWEQVLKL
jgi:3-dehydro-L-gulonate 2-dehydrogenase